MAGAGSSRPRAGSPPPWVEQRCIAFARVHGLQLVARADGHSYGGYSSFPGLVVDVSRMSGVQVAGHAGIATIGAGARLIDIYHTVGAAGIVLPGGSCPTVGIAGLALGGGIGVFGRAYGLTCDNIESLQVVTADGKLRTVSAAYDPDLYWASRGGGGGNFGIATSFTFTVHPIPQVSLFTLTWPWAAAGIVLAAWQQWSPRAPDELWSNCQLLSSGGSGLTLRATGVFAGTPPACTSALAACQQVPSAGGGMVFDPYGGAIGRVAPSATAFVHRTAIAAVEYSVNWASGMSHGMINAGAGWLSKAQSDLAPCSTGSFVNYIDPTLHGWQEAYDGTNLARLVQVKRAVDPDDVFHFAQSVPTLLTS